MLSATLLKKVQLKEVKGGGVNGEMKKKIYSML
jgi:hypothetical protein